MNRIHALFSEWQSLQPLKVDDQKRLDDKLRLEFNYNSNHIEGNTLTYGQTKLLLFFGETEGRHELREYEEMKAHDVAIRMIRAESKDSDRHLSEKFIRELNQTLLVEPFKTIAETPDGQPTEIAVSVGEYKSRPNHVRTAMGETFYYASPEETPSMMTALVDWYNDEERKAELSPIELASLMHYRYIRIHPFEDGNGRIARLLINYVLLRHGYPMIIIETKDKDNYLRILHRCDVAVGLTPSDGANAPLEIIQPFTDYLTTRLERAFDISIKAAKGEGIDEEDDFEKQLALIERQLNTPADTTYSTNKAIDVIEHFYLPFTEEIKTKLLSASRLFSNVEVCNYIKFAGEDDIDKTYLFSKISDVRDVIVRIKIVDFAYRLAQPKHLKLKHIEYFLFIELVFSDNGYTVSCFEHNEFSYGQFPSREQMDTAINRFKSDILSQIEKAMNERS